VAICCMTLLADMAASAIGAPASVSFLMVHNLVLYHY